MPAKDKKYRRAKKQLESYQNYLDSLSSKVFSQLNTFVWALFDKTKGLYIGTYHHKKYTKEHGPKINPEDFVEREKKQKYRAPIRRQG